MKSLLSSDDIKNIESAVKNAEGITSGEIVICVTPKSGCYPEAPLRGGILAAL